MSRKTTDSLESVVFVWYTFVKGRDIMHVIIRAFEEDDYDIVNAIIQESFSVSKARKINHNNHVHEFVAVVENRIVGYFILNFIDDIIKNKKWGYVQYVCVEKSFRNRGIAKKMMEYAISFSKREKASYLELTSGYQREAAHHLYIRCGFQKRESFIFRREL